MAGRRALKAVAVLITLGYCSILAYQSGVSFNFQESQTATLQVSEFSIEPATRPSLDDGETKNITLDDIFISVKTSKVYQETRLPIILKTWFQLAKNQTWFFTDIDNPQHQVQTGGHMVNTNCASTHQIRDLCCKMSVEYDTFLDSGKKWFCHFDDDNYVNVPRLLTVLQNYSHQEDWYLGRNSVSKPVKRITKSKLMFKFWFLTGGAGFCISSSLALKMLPVASGGRLMSLCESKAFPDDVSIGFVINQLLKINMTIVPEFHSHLEEMKLLEPSTFKDQISFGYFHNKEKWNVVKVPGFDIKYDPTRFLSLHCFLFPHFKYCPR